MTEAYSIATYVDGIECLAQQEPLNLFYSVNITALKDGVVEFDLPPGASKVVYSYVSNNIFHPDKTFNMGGKPAQWGILESFNINGNHVIAKVKATLGGTGYCGFGLHFYNAEGVTCRVLS